jgi:hypothetical protein
VKKFLILFNIVFLAVYAGAVVALYYLGRLPHDIKTLDLLLLVFASARLMDIITTDEIMMWLREPFVQTEKVEIAGRQVLVRGGRGQGLRKAIGEMLSCPWCTGVWVAAGLAYLYFLIPKIIWLFILVFAISEIGSLIQAVSTILVRLLKYLKGLGMPDGGE